MRTGSIGVGLLALVGTALSTPLGPARAQPSVAGGGAARSARTAEEPRVTHADGSPTPPSPILATAAEQAAMLRSADPQLAANKKLVYDMYRAIVQGGHAEMVEQFFTPDYIQHNPNIVSGRDALATFLRNSRPARPIEPLIVLPVIAMMAEGDMVLVVGRRPEKDEHGDYITTWFDLYRIQDGKIAEHWDPALRSAAMLKFDPNSKR